MARVDERGRRTRRVMERRLGEGIAGLSAPGPECPYGKGVLISCKVDTVDKAGMLDMEFVSAFEGVSTITPR